MFDTYIEEWLKDLSITGSSHNTIESYRLDINGFFLFCKEYMEDSSNIEHISKHEVRAYFLKIKNNSITQKTIARKLSSIKSFFKFLISKEIIKSSNILYMKTPKVENNLPRPLLIKQINDLVVSVNGLTKTYWIIKRDQAILCLVYSVGLRLYEALSLNKKDIQHSSGFINILGKGGKIRSVPLIAEIKTIIENYIELCPFKNAEALFLNSKGNRLSSNTMQKLMRKLRNILKLSNNVTMHSLRHSCATHLMEQSGDIRGIQELLGHKSISTTQIYANVAKEYISKVYEECHPLSAIKKQA